MDLETGKAEDSKSQRPKSVVLTDLEKGTIHKPHDSLFICKFNMVHCGI